MANMFSKKRKTAVENRFEGRCGYCGIKPPRLQIDHIIPISRGGSHTIENLMPACQPCNGFKSDLLLENFRSKVSAQVEKMRQSSANFRIAEKYGLISVKRPMRTTFYFETVKHV